MTHLKLNESKNTKGSTLWIVDENQGWSNLPVSNEEKKYIQSQLKEHQKKLFAFNHLQFFTFVLLLKDAQPNASALEQLRLTGAKVCSTLNEHKQVEITLQNQLKHGAVTLALAEGMALANYQFLNFRKEAKKELNSLKTIALTDKTLTKTHVAELAHVVEATCMARDLVNLPVSHLTAVQLANAFKSMGKEAGFKVEVLNKNKIEALKMGGLLAVNKGSQQPPTFTIMEYKPAKAVNKKPYVLVGKGVVYDTGGLSLKPTPGSMDAMKSDMAGAAAVGATMYALAKAKLPVHVIALVPATDNRPGETAYTPGDVIVQHNGLTVEVLNTDAEGRLILADALSYAQKYKPELTIDLATLTGAAVAAIGKYGIVSMGTAPAEVHQKLKDSGEQVYERLAEFPFWDEYNELLKSTVADLKNIGGPQGGAITAGKFLAYFVDYPWIHLDIAGPSFLSGSEPYKPVGGSGVGVRLLFHFFKSLTTR